MSDTESTTSRSESFVSRSKSLLSRSSSTSTSSGSKKWTIMQSQLHSPMPASLSGECEKAEAILRSFLYPKAKKSHDEDTELGIPRAILSRARGLAIFTATKAGLVGSYRYGSGLIIVRLPDNSWSAPSAMSTGGVGFGTQLGFEKTDFVFVLNSDKAIKTFSKSGSITLGKNLSVALGPYGRSAEFSGVLSSKGLSGMFAYSKSRGVFGGKSWEGGVIGERAEANKKMYGRTISAEELLSGKVEPPVGSGPLMDILNSEKFQPLDDSDVSPMTSAEDLSQGYQQQQRQQYRRQPMKYEPQGPIELSAETTAGQPVELPGGSTVMPVELPAHTPSDMPVELPAEMPGDLPKKVGEISIDGTLKASELDAAPVNEVFELPAYDIDASEPPVMEPAPLKPAGSETVEQDTLQPPPLRISKRGGEA